MANTLTNLIPTMYSALDVVSRELVGFIRASTRDSRTEQAALNQSVRVPVVAAASAADNTAAVTPPDTGDETTDSTEITISKSKHVPIRFNGEEVVGLSNAGTYNEIVQKRMEQAFRTLTNLIEADLASQYVRASRAYGTAGTAPFATASDLSDLAQVMKILDDNGAPASDRQLVVNTAAKANLFGKQSGLFKANEAGTDELLRRGILTMIEGVEVHYSGQVAAHTKGTGTGYLVNDGTPPGVGDTSITTDTGTGTILDGDVVTLAGDTNKYIVAVDHAANTLVLNNPGLRVAADDDDAITVGNAYAANLAFSKSALILATRLPAVPQQGDMAIDRRSIVDPISGLAFEVALYAGFRQMTIHIGIAWGYKGLKSEHMAILLG